MCNITSAGGQFVLDGSLVLDVPAGAVASGTTVSITATSISTLPPVASGYQVHKAWRLEANTSAFLNAAAQLNHPLVGGLTTDGKLRFYARKGSIAGPIPCDWAPQPESPLGNSLVDGGTGYLPPANPTGPDFKSYLCLVQIP